MARLVLQLAYDGTHFCGWQIQPGQRTAQGSLQQALSTICNQQVKVHGSGRTDAGAHALGQAAHCDVPENKVEVPWRRALNSLLPGDVCVLSAWWEDSSFHARHSARGKVYSYTLWTASEYVLPQRRPYVWPTGPLDQEAMREAVRVLLGRRDFAAMQNVGTPLAHTVRSVSRVRLCWGERPEELVCFFTADGFLKQMVRVMASCLVEAGRHRLGPRELEDILGSLDRCRAPATAPAKGLCLERVFYDKPDSAGGTANRKPEWTGL